MEWRGVSVLVTGAAGFVGSHLAERLVRAGARVRGLIRYTSDPPRRAVRFLPDDVRREIEFVRGDLRDPEAVDQAVAGCRTVFHLGALVSVPYSFLHPRDVLETNVLGTLNVLEAARRRAGVRVVHTSSSEVYGSARYTPMDERHPLQAQSPYAASKIAADKLVESYVRTYGLDAVTVRPFNSYGPRQSARAVIPSLLSQALAGGVLRVGRLTPRRDFTFVTDTVAGFLAVAAHGESGGVFNVGSGRDVSIAGLVDRIREVLGLRLEVEVRDERLRPEDSEVDRLLADSTLARDLLGWSPVTSLDDGLRQTAAWIAEHPEWFPAADWQI